MLLDRPRLAWTALLLSISTVGSSAQTVLYDAGSAGNPPVAPDPTSQGWMRTDSSGGAITGTPVSPDAGTGRNAWQIDDPIVTTGGLVYGWYFCEEELVDAAVSGWEYELEIRMISGVDDCIYFEYSSGREASDDRYLVFFKISGADVIANPIAGGTPIVCAGAMDGSYHTFTLRKPPGPTNLDAEFLYDGTVLGTVPRSGGTPFSVDGGVVFGAGSSPGTGTCNFTRVAFSAGLDEIGDPYCGPAVANSTGLPGFMRVSGSTDVAVNQVALAAGQLPSGQFGYFLVSTAQGFVPNPGGAQGNLCVTGAIGRYNQPSEIIVGPAGCVPIDLASTPQPTGDVAVQPGETWNFQCWYRDNDPTPTSNFTDAVSVTFE